MTSKKPCKHPNIETADGGGFRCIDCGSPYPPKGSKYGNKIVKTEDGTFHSKAELKRWEELKLLQKAGLICGLERQVWFDLIVNDRHVGFYVADFTYRKDPLKFAELLAIPKSGTVCEDVKGGRATQTEAFKLKAKLMKAIHGIDILITGREKNEKAYHRGGAVRRASAKSR
jgi:hypothetical protein